MTSQRTKESIDAALVSGVDIVGRRIFLQTVMEEDAVAVVIRGLYLLGGGKEHIELIVSSTGGDMDEAFGLHDATRIIDAPVHTVALGKCHSAAPLIVACGAKGCRYTTEHCVFMLHDVSVEASPGSPVMIETETGWAKKSMVRYAELLEQYTNMPKKHWTQIFAKKKDTYFDAETAVEWGLVDTIWSQK